MYLLKIVLSSSPKVSQGVDNISKSEHMDAGVNSRIFQHYFSKRISKSIKSSQNRREGYEFACEASFFYSSIILYNISVAVEDRVYFIRHVDRSSNCATANNRSANIVAGGGAFLRSSILLCIPILKAKSYESCTYLRLHLMATTRHQYLPSRIVPYFDALVYTYPKHLYCAGYGWHQYHYRITLSTVATGTTTQVGPYLANSTEQCLLYHQSFLCIAIELIGPSSSLSSILQQRLVQPCHIVP